MSVSEEPLDGRPLGSMSLRDIMLTGPVGKPYTKSERESSPSSKAVAKCKIGSIFCCADSAQVVAPLVTEKVM